MKIDLARAQLLTGGEAVAEAMRQVDPDVVPVYPITPQTPIIQTFAKAVADGRAHGELVDVESEHSAMSAAVAAALAGARTMTATSSQGLALMAEIVYIAASMRAPVVMALGNRALSGPINIHCDHSDSMLIRDSGAIQLFAENAQEAYDLTVIAPRLAEHPEVLLPVLVCLDGFTITHSAEPVAPLADDAGACVRGRVPAPARASRPRARRPRQGPFAMPDYYFELRRRQTEAIQIALEIFAELCVEYEELSRRVVRPVRGLPARRRGARTRLPRLQRRHGEGRGGRAARRGRGRRPAEDLLVPAVPGRGDPAALRRPRDGCRARPRRLARRGAAFVRRGRRGAPAGCRLRFAVMSTASAGATSTRPTSAPPSTAPRPTTSASGACHVPSEDTRPHRGRDAAAPQRPLALPGLWDPDGRPHGARLDRRADGRRQRNRLPRGRDDPLPDHGLERSVAARRVRERGRRRERSRERIPRASPPRRPATRGRADDRGVRRRRRDVRHRPAGALRGTRARPPLRLRLLRQPGLHEHRDPALGRDPVRRGDDDDAGRARCRSGSCSSART